MSKARIDIIRERIKKENLDGYLVTNLDQVRYLCGYSGSNGLLVITERAAHFLTDFRYIEQARKEVKGARRTIVKTGDLIGGLSEITRLGRRNLRFGFDPASVSISKMNALRAALPNILRVAAPNVMAELGWVKEPAEINNIRRAATIADTAFERILNIIRPGAREREIAAELEYQMTMLGSEKPAFESIVASGPRGALPHGIASDRKIKNNELITFDFGATVGGYVSDITRTVMLGKASTKQKKIYNIVLRAQKAGVRKVRPGVSGKAVDHACRKIITDAGYGKQFGHGTGHGIGIIVHTGPSANAKSQDILKVNNVITVEPGIYLPGWGGVRIEDDVLVTRSGHEVLTHAEKKLLEL